MSKLDITAIRALADAASPGPWKSWAGNPWSADTGRKPHGPRSLQCGNGSGAPDGQDAANIAFCAAAREAIPALCDEIARLTRPGAMKLDIAAIRAQAKEATRGQGKLCNDIPWVAIVERTEMEESELPNITESQKVDLLVAARNVAGLCDEVERLTRLLGDQDVRS